MIFMKWKDNWHTIMDIYSVYKYDIINHESLFSHYDLFFKFHIAVIYHEIRICLKPDCFQLIKDNFYDILTINDFPEE